MIAFSYIISFLIGGLLLRALTRKEQTDPLLTFVLACGLGLGTSSHLTFYSYVLFDSLNKIFVLGVHFALLAALIFCNRPWPRVSRPSSVFYNNPRVWSAVVLFSLLCIPLWIQANYYPFGGWDAWSCWNLKAKFLFLGGEEWKNIFDPTLWRASPHYPLLLPLIHVWGWIFTKTASHWVPLINALIFTLLTAGLLFSGLRMHTRTLFAATGAALILTLSFFVKLTVSQYSDITLSYYLLAGLICFLISYAKDSKSFALLSGLFLGLLTFTKPEGTIAGALVVLTTLISLLFDRQKPKNKRNALLISLFSGFLINFLPTVLFQILYAPANQTFINGFLSASDPLTAERVKITAFFFLIEPFSGKWHGIWILLLGGLFLSKGRCLDRDLRIIPAFLFSYLAIVFFYYLTNTYFEISWWLSVTLNRILFSLLPLCVFWVFYSVGKMQSTARK